MKKATTTATTKKKTIRSTTAKDKKSPKDIKVIKEDDLAIVTGGVTSAINFQDCI